MSMKMAKPKEGEFETVLRFLQGLEHINNTWTLPPNHENDDAADEEEDEECEEASDEEIVAWIDREWPAVDMAYQRVLLAGQTAILNACDPDPSVHTLEWKPEIANLKAENDRLAAEVAHWRHLYESQHMPRLEGFKPTEAP